MASVCLSERKNLYVVSGSDQKELIRLLERKKIKHKFKEYDDVGIVFNPNDKNYKIVAIEGTLYFKNKNIEKCYEKQNEIVKEIKGSLNLNIKEDIWYVPKNRLKNDEKSLKYIDFNFIRYYIMQLFSI